MEESSLYRIIIFASVLAVMAGLEFVIPKRKLLTFRSRRWLTNLTIAAIGNGLVRLMGMIALPVVALTAAAFASDQGWGLLPLLGLPLWVDIIITIVILDLAIYVQHVASHHIPFLWRLHRVHHADTDIDVTTAVRFHPGEIVLSMLYKAALILLLGPPILGVFLFEVILSSCAMFNHSNVDLPKPMDKILRLFLVTPDMHRVHHSVHENETNSNYGFNIPLWDYIFGTYTSQPKDGHKGMTVGLSQYQTTGPTQLVWSLFLPFRKNASQENPRPLKDQAENSVE